MSEKKIAKPVALAVGAALASTFAISGTVNAADTAESPFQISSLEIGYMLSEHEGKCGEGSCGEKKDKKGEGSCGEGSCGESHDKKGEGACGEGSCGGDKGDKDKDKEGEGKCGEGSCGSV
jgi:uncharacterized low-complexity protein